MCNWHLKSVSSSMKKKGTSERAWEWTKLKVAKNVNLMRSWWRWELFEVATNSEPKSPLWRHLSYPPPSLTLSALISNTAWQCNPQKGGGGRKSSITELYVGWIISPVSSYLPSSLITPPAPAQNTKLGWSFLPFPLHWPYIIHFIKSRVGERGGGKT